MRDYNFFSIYEKKRDFIFNIKSPYTISGIIILLCILLSAGFIIRNMILENNIQEMQAQIDSIQKSSDYKEANELNNRIDAMNKYEQIADIALENFQAADTLDSELINNLFKGIPANAVITDFTIINTGFSMSCNVPSRKAAAELVLGLKGTNLLHEVQLISVSLQEGNTYKAMLDGVLKVGDQK